MSKEIKNLVRVCDTYHIDSKRLFSITKMMLNYRHKEASYREMYQRQVMQEGPEKVFRMLRMYLYGIHDPDVTKKAALEKAFSMLSGSGMLDAIIEESIDIVERRFGSIGEDFYRPILDMRYGEDGGDYWWLVEQKVGLGHSQTYTRFKEAVLAVGLVFFTELYEYCIRSLLDEEEKGEVITVKKYKTRKVKGVRIVTEIKGRKDRLLMPRPAVFDLKTKYNRNREKRQTRKEIDFY